MITHAHITSNRKKKKKRSESDAFISQSPFTLERFYDTNTCMTITQPSPPNPPPLLTLTDVCIGILYHELLSYRIEKK